LQGQVAAIVGKGLSQACYGKGLAGRSTNQQIAIRGIIDQRSEVAMVGHAIGSEWLTRHVAAVALGQHGRGERLDFGKTDRRPP